MKRVRFAPLVTLPLVTLLLAACTSRTATTEAPSPTPATTTSSPVTSSPVTSSSDDVLYLNLMWHQHQPRYPLDEDGHVTRPWVRVHATKDYYDMAALVAEYPDVHVTFNLTPGLLLQLEELSNGTKDVYWALSEVPPARLTEDERRFVIQRFFDTNPAIVDRFPRYRELADARAAAGGEDAPVTVFDEQELLDLQVLFNLAWMDPSFLSTAPLDALVAKGRRFEERDKEILFDEQSRIIEDVIPLHARLWESGQIEVTTSPLAHPILPLLADTELATVGDQGAVLPSDRFRQVQDADLQVGRGLDVAERLLGRRPVGMWPGEGSVAELVMWLFSKNGVRWVASGEEVLAASTGAGSFERDAADTVQRADELYRPRNADVTNREPVAMFFRDGVLSDRVGFEYSGMQAEAAADDFMGRLEAVRAELASEGAAGRPHLVSVILDGENAWESYPNDGIDFLRALYERLGASSTIRTITPSAFLEITGEPEVLHDVWPGAWFQPNFSTWIGEPEEATAWEYLYATREDLRLAGGSGSYSAQQLESAMQAMLFAEGSDWFWWFGADQNSGQDGYFDEAFRQLLGEVYDALGEPHPPLIDVPIIPKAPVTPDVAATDLIAPVLDGELGADEWAAAGRYEGDAPVRTLQVGYDETHLYIGLELVESQPVEIYVGSPSLDRTRGTTLEGSILGFAAGALVSWSPEDGACLMAGLPSLGRESATTDCADVEAGAAGAAVELAVPLEGIGPVEAGDAVLLAVAAGSAAQVLFPEDGPAVAPVPDISNVDAFLQVGDPLDDDHGPGTYTYPTDQVFTAGSYDLKWFEAGTEGDDVVFTFEVDAPIANPWGSPNGLSVQTFDIYIDTDPGAGTGARLLLPGRNAAMQEGNGWEYGITIEGWDPAVYVISADGTATETKPSFGVAVLADKGKAIVRLPRSILGEGDPAAWGYAAVVLSQEGFPSPGVRRVRNVEGVSQQWTVGGAPADVNHTRIMDLVWPEGGVQEDMLGSYPPLQGSADDFGPDDLPQVPLLIA